MFFLKCIYQRQFAKLIYRHGITYEQRQSYQQAIDAFTSAIAMGYFPQAKAIVHRGVNRLNMQDREGAIADFERVINSEELTANTASNLPLAQAYFYRGQLRQQNNQQSKAAVMNDWARAIAACSTYSLPYYHRALVWLSQGDHDRATDDLNAAVAAHPVLALAYFQRGNLRAQLGDTSGAIADLTYAVCNDFTLKEAKEKLEDLQQGTYDDQLSEVLAGPLTARGLSVKVHHKGDRLDIQVHRAIGVGVNYYTLPALIREHLVPLLLDDVSHFRLTGLAGDATTPDWHQSYGLYKDQPCPPSHWLAAIVAVVMFPPLAVPALILAARVQIAYKKGNYVEALSASGAAKVLSLASSVPFALCLMLSLSYASYRPEKESPVLSTVEQLEIANQLEREIEKR